MEKLLSVSEKMFKAIEGMLSISPLWLLDESCINTEHEEEGHALHYAYGQLKQAHSEYAQYVLSHQSKEVDVKEAIEREYPITDEFQHGTTQRMLRSVMLKGYNLRGGVDWDKVKHDWQEFRGYPVHNDESIFNWFKQQIAK